MFFKPEYILILAFTIVVDYFAGIIIASTENVKKKKKFLIVSLVANISVLGFFKYYNFINYNIVDAAAYFGYEIEVPLLTMLLPIGLSFHTFQAMSYTIEVYRGNQPAERHFGIYALYVMFFPQLVAGPIERPQNLLPQFHEKKVFNPDLAVSGLKLMAWGLFKKLVIADRLSLMVDQVYNSPENYRGLNIVIATLFFAEQIYCDFSGYSDIAIGSARVLGFDLMKNFRNPYLSKSISEFWSRWHISLSTWFKDYLYIPLGGNRVSVPRWMFNLLITFLVSGFWHGANWTFIIWGGLNGIFIMGEIFIDKKRNTFSIPTIIKRSTTVILICVTWIFFRVNTLKDAGTVFRNIFSNSQTFAFDLTQFLLAVLLIIGLEIIQFMDEKNNVMSKIKTLPYLIKIPIYAVFLTVLLNFGIFNNSQFIYFQF
ncbi:MBOAT family O-acyltransferase [Segetibacter aerophilus]|uniref:Alginate O-acetyltransferase n=1 Tax=Segetibacter aerophilus TaxID=670293 RepID=A0A512BH94_9BACT|nr:MBOAT family O-acyltransferase [Segetibacter aerophilus]GEO11245.1 alginate O-acetyltransferase [Segetibacter aerophilus]